MELSNRKILKETKKKVKKRKKEWHLGNKCNYILWVLGAIENLTSENSFL